MAGDTGAARKPGWKALLLSGEGREVGLELIKLPASLFDLDFWSEISRLASFSPLPSPGINLCQKAVQILKKLSEILFLEHFWSISVPIPNVPFL